MNTLTVSFSRLLVAGVLWSSVALAQTPAPKLTIPASSPESTLKQKLGFTDIEIAYGRPSVRARKIFGGLLPYGEVWRTGANTSTKVTFSAPVMIEGKPLAAGSYALFSIPDAKEWTVIFNRVTGEWGAYTYKEANDALRVKVKPVALAQAVETFTIDFNDVKTESATLNLSWEKTRVPVTIGFEVVKPVLAQIDALMASGATLTPGIYFQAAMFYYENGQDLAKARAWVDEAAKSERSRFYFLHGKAKIQARMGDKAGARETARKSIELAEKEGPALASEYKRLNETLIASLK